MEEVKTDKESTSSVSETETITSKNEPSTPATAEIDEVEKPSEEKEVNKDIKDGNNAEESATVESLTENLKRELTLKRKEDEVPKPEPVPNVQETQVDKKKKSKKCCTLM